MDKLVSNIILTFQWLLEQIGDLPFGSLMKLILEEIVLV